MTSQEAGITPACKCASYNRPDLGGDVPEVVLQVPEWAKTPERETICVDACIADHVKSLWSAGIWTLNSCCGHNGAFSRSIIVDRSDHAAAQAIMDQMGAGIKIMSWQLCPQPAALTATPQQAAKVYTIKFLEKGELQSSEPSKVTMIGRYDFYKCNSYLREAGCDVLEICEYDVTTPESLRAIASEDSQ